LIKTTLGLQACSAAMASSNHVYVSVRYVWCTWSLTECPLGDDRWWILLQAPSYFGASPGGDAMYLAGRVVSVMIWLVDMRCSMTFVIEVGSLRADGRLSPRMNCGGPV